MKLTPERYIHELLVEHLHVVEVVVGENFTFGKKAAGTVETLRRAGNGSGSRSKRCHWCPSAMTAKR
ncbi:FAD synthetase family protein [Mycobacterium xenopi 4042]|uniref:FAD synthase n=1 Tax=Mycobacterium xenopi 4042 TaxID=1299334 RepID=X8CEL5_MYCXE|nr:FAD synthetase family protein [Mycobacterium xenopi 4042]